jgi:hypothetical protein
MPNKNNQLTICFDFDESLSLYHLHNLCTDIINQIKQEGSEEEKLSLAANRTEFLWKKLAEDEKLKAAGDATIWRDLINQHLNDYHIAIVSRSAYPEIIEKFLREVIQLDDVAMQKIHIEAGNTRAPSKQGHIERVLKHFSVIPPITDKSKPLLGVIMLEDTPEELALLTKLGCTPISLPKGEENAKEAAKKLPIEISNLIKNVDKQRELILDEERLIWLGDKLALVSRIHDELTTQRFSQLNNLLRSIDNETITFSNAVQQLETIYKNLLKESQAKLSETPWGSSPAVMVRNINTYPDQFHALRLSALMLKEIYAKYPKTRNEKIANVIQHIRDIPTGYQEGNTKLVEKETVKAEKEETNVKPQSSFRYW